MVALSITALSISANPAVKRFTLAESIAKDVIVAFEIVALSIVRIAPGSTPILSTLIVANLALSAVISPVTSRFRIVAESIVALSAVRVPTRSLLKVAESPSNPVTSNVPGGLPNNLLLMLSKLTAN